MSITLYLPATGIPGTGTEIRTTEQDLSGMFYGPMQGIILTPSTACTIDGESLDAGNTGFTTVLRQGLVMGKVTSTGKWKPFSESATDGTEVARGILLLATAIPNSLDIINAQIMVAAPCLEPAGLCLASSSSYGIGTTGAGLTVRKHLARNFLFSDDFGSLLRNDVILASANGALSIADSPIVITKTGSLAALTLAAPTVAQNGLRMTITSSTAFAHTVTATGLINDGVTGGSKNLATFAAFAGASMELMAYAGKWQVLSLNAVTIS